MHSFSEYRQFAELTMRYLLLIVETRFLWRKRRQYNTAPLSFQI
ncbi:MAG: hypothetical protein ACKVZH_15540 [Blastocatellia bacterium]